MREDVVVSSSEMTKSRAYHPTNKVPATVSAVNDVRNRGAFVTCKDLAYSVKSSKFRKTWITIVQNVSFYLAPRELTAIIGPSGCGKTTLLDLLAGRKRAGRISPQSQILYDGEKPTAKYLRRHVGYVEQHDTLLSMMTPYEMLLYTAELKHSRYQPMSQKQSQVMQLIDKLNLNDCKDTVIGSVAKRGISGGEAKRTNIGIALISDPAVLYIDELTSGLDSFTGHEVALAVKALSESGITICATLHSPPAYTFELFDRILLLQHGQIVYFGSNGTAVIDYFAHTFPQLRGMRQTEGIADFLLDVTTKANKEAAQAAAFIDSYSNSDLFKLNACIIESKSVERCRRTEHSDVEAGEDLGQTALPIHVTSSLRTSLGFSNGSRTINPMWWALYVMWRHRSLKVYRQPSFIAPRVFDKVMIVFLVVTLWWRVGGDPANANITASILFLWSMLTAFLAMGMLPTIVIERPVTYREMYDGLFSPVTYVAYKLVEELIPQAVAGVIYSILVYFLINLQGSFLVFWLVYLVSTFNAVASTMMVSAASVNTSAAGAIMSSYATTLFFFSGFLIPFSKIPVYWRWYSVIDHLRYAFGAMMANQFSGNDPELFAGQTVLQYYDLENVHAWAWLGFELVFFPVFIILFWAALKWIRY